MQEKEDDLLVQNDTKGSEIQLTTLNYSSFIGSPCGETIIQSDDNSDQHQAISFWKALFIPVIIIIFEFFST